MGNKLSRKQVLIFGEYAAAVFYHNAVSFLQNIHIDAL